MSTLDRWEEHIVRWLARHGLLLLRVSLGVVFLWFGALKFVPGFSPAEDLAGATIATLTFGLVPPKLALLVLAMWESAIGLALVFGVQLRLAIGLLLLQMAGTLTPLLLFPAETFVQFPIAPTLEGQYILKNLVLISAALVLGATVRGGRLTTGPVMRGRVLRLRERSRQFSRFQSEQEHHVEREPDRDPDHQQRVRVPHRDLRLRRARRVQLRPRLPVPERV